MSRNPNLTYRDFAVFMRLNALSRAYEQEFMKYGIPCKIFGGYRFFERKEIKDVLSYLKVVNNPLDNESFLRCISTPKRGIGDKTLGELRAFCLLNGLSLYQGLSKLDLTTISGAAKNKLNNFKTLLDSFCAYASVNKVVDLIDYILETTGFLEQYADKSEENTSKLLNISELKNSADQFEKDNNGATLADYLNSVTLSSDTDALDADDAVAIATIHAAKGLEYKIVFVAGLDEEILPVSRGFDSDDEMEEERRLMYVAVTRAKERLYLTRANSRYMYGNRNYMRQSRFLKEAQPVLSPKIEEVRVEKKEKDYSFYRDDFSDERPVGGSGYSSNYAKTFLKSTAPKENTKVEYSKYVRGCKVVHAKFGNGTVIDLKGEGDNLIVHVAFQGVGIKALSAKFAPMEIV
jgi:DNA helicase-2/ATP-dependent DNA helicase PcrA